jgi:hypothetical protein
VRHEQQPPASAKMAEDFLVRSGGVALQQHLLKPVGG